MVTKKTSQLKRNSPLLPRFLSSAHKHHPAYYEVEQSNRVYRECSSLFQSDVPEEPHRGICGPQKSDTDKDASQDDTRQEQGKDSGNDEGEDAVSENTD